MSFFTLKLIAVLTMFYDHFTILYEAIFPTAPLMAITEALCTRFPAWENGIVFFCFALPQWILPYIGRLSAPIFMFCVANGYRHTRNVKRYAIRIFAFAVAAQLPYILFFRAWSITYGLAPSPAWLTELNFMFTLGLGLLAIWAFERLRAKGLPASFGGAAVFILLAGLLRTEGGANYAALVLAFHLTMDMPRGKRALIWLLLFPLARWRDMALLFAEPSFSLVRSVILNVFGPWLGVLLTLCYNGEKGRAGKAAQYFVYSFYPLHLLILALPTLLT